MEIKVMAKLVTQGAEERAERGYLLADCSPPPNADHERAWMVIAEKLRRRIFADSKRPGGKDPHAAFRHAVEHRRGPKKFAAGSLNIRRRAILHSPLDKLCACEQTPVRRQHSTRNADALLPQSDHAKQAVGVVARPGSKEKLIVGAVGAAVCAK